MSEENTNWIADDTLGPIMRKKTLAAIRSLSREGQTFVTLTGVRGQPEGRFDRCVYWEPFMPGPLRTDEVDREIRQRFDYLLTKTNYKKVIEAYEAAALAAAETRPVRDEQRDPDEEVERKTRAARYEAERKELADRQDALRAEVRAAAPPGATRVIVALLMEDTSDPMSDYFSNKTVRSVAIGFSTKSREDFRLLHDAARRFKDTACYYTESGDKLEERRDNYSMGAGNYLSDHGWDGAGSGWVVKSREIDSNWWSVDEIALPDRVDA